MPRQKVDPRNRKRVAQACDACKRRKEKCDGGTPCGQCTSRRREDGCRFTNTRFNQPPSQESGHSGSEAHVTLSDDPVHTAPLLDVSKRNDGETYGAHTPAAPIPKGSTMLRDGQGKLIYLGESASLTFLQTVRSAVTLATGPCPFTIDPLSHLMIESTPTLRLENTQEPSINTDAARALADQFFLVASGIVDLFDPSWLAAELESKHKSAVVYLALSIGAQGRAHDASDDLFAEQCFAYGRQLAMFTLMDDPSLPTVQAFTLITYYMSAACRRNAAFTNLGVAVRAAYSLGIHLHETNAAFVREEGIARERAWKSLRVMDLWLSGSMGRPPATVEATCNLPWSSVESTSDRENSSVASQASSAMFRICNIFERILVEVYSRKAVTLELAKSISRQLREWTEELPGMLRIDRLEDASCLEQAADACVDSAITGVDIAHEFVFKKETAKRQPFVVNTVFISALCLGLAYLGDYDQKRWPLGRSLDRSIDILTHLGHLNPQSSRYAETCRLLKDATTIYVRKRDDALLQSNNSLVRSVFGNVRASAGSFPSNQSPNQLVATLPLDDGGGHPISPSSIDSSLRQEFIFPTSGITPGQTASRHSYQDNLDMLPQHFLSSDAMEPLEGYAFEQDVPLFSVTNDIALEGYHWH